MGGVSTLSNALHEKVAEAFNVLQAKQAVSSAVSHHWACTRSRSRRLAATFPGSWCLEAVQGGVSSLLPSAVMPESAC